MMIFLPILCLFQNPKIHLIQNRGMINKNACLEIEYLRQITRISGQRLNVANNAVASREV